MNLLELQVLAVVSRIPNGTDAPSPESFVEPAGPAPNGQPERSDTNSRQPAVDAGHGKQTV
jgi:hypothetical protein